MANSKLRPLLADYSMADVRKLAGKQDDFWRQEFVKLVGIAEGLGQPR
jgi:Ca-activated chloride channel homolog